MLPHRPDCITFLRVCCVCQIACVLCHTCPLLPFAVNCIIAECQGQVGLSGSDVGALGVVTFKAAVRMRLLSHGRLWQLLRLGSSRPPVAIVLFDAAGPHAPRTRLPLFAGEPSWILYLLLHPSLTVLSSSSLSLPHGVSTQCLCGSRLLPHPTRHQSLFQCA